MQQLITAFFHNYGSHIYEEVQPQYNNKLVKVIDEEIIKIKIKKAPKNKWWI